MRECPTCGGEYQRLGQHFAFNQEHRPSLSEYQREVVELLVLWGVHIREDSAESRLEVYSTNESTIRVVADALGWLANEPRIHERGEKIARRAAERNGAGEKFPVQNYNDVWAVSTVPHPELANYSQGPESVSELTRNTLRWLIQSTSTWQGMGPFGSLHVDVRGWAVGGDFLRELLHEAGVETIDGSMTDDTPYASGTN